MSLNFLGFGASVEEMAGRNPTDVTSKLALDGASDAKSLCFLCVPLCKRGHLMRHPRAPPN